jgi:uncharacterized integral membrane protein
MATSSQDPAPPERGRRELGSSEHDRRELARTGFGIAVVVVAIVFALVNLNSVKVDWIVGSGHAPLIIVIAISVLAGAVMGWLGQRASRRRRRH